MAIEDAALLSSILTQQCSSKDLQNCLHNFELQRMERKRRVQELSFHNLELYHLSDGELQRKRDRPRHCEGAKDLRPIWRNEEDQAWLYGYDI